MTTHKKPSPLSIWASPEGALVLAAAGVTAAVASMPIVLVPGVLAYGILTYLRFARTKAGGGEDLTPIAPDLSRLAPLYAARVRRAAARQGAILSELSDAAPEHRALLAGTADRVRNLVTAAVRLAERLEALDRHLVADARADVERETRALQHKVRSAVDPQAREAYARALSQQQQKEKVLQELGARRERLDAQLLGIEKTLETTFTQVVRIKSAEGSLDTGEGARIAESLDALAVEVDAAAETVDEAAEYEPLTTRR